MDKSYPKTDAEIVALLCGNLLLCLLAQGQRNTAAFHKLWHKITENKDHSFYEKAMERK